MNWVVQKIIYINGADEIVKLSNPRKSAIDDVLAKLRPKIHAMIRIIHLYTIEETIQ